MKRGSGLVKSGKKRRPTAGKVDREEIRSLARATAQGWLDRRPVFLDVETTGLTGLDQVLQVGIVDYQGDFLVDTSIKPTCEISDRASEVHGITSEQVTEAPAFADVWAVMSTILKNRVVIAYNSQFDLRMIEQSLEEAGIQSKTIDGIRRLTFCAMRLYARYWGERNTNRGGYKWQKLLAACVQQQIAMAANLHSAVVDAEATRRLVYKIAGAEVPDA